MDEVQIEVKKDLQKVMGPEYKSHKVTEKRATRSLAVLAETLDEDPEAFFKFMTEDITLSREVLAKLDEKVTAYRMVLPQYADHVTQLAKNAVTEEEVLHAYAHMAKLHEMAAGVKGIGTEMGRGLSAHNIIAKNLGDLDALKAAASGLDDMTVRQMKGALDVFAQGVDVPTKLRIAKNSLKYRWGSAFLSYRQAQLLWSISTHMRNFGTNAALLSGGSVIRTVGAIGHSIARGDLMPLKAMVQYFSKGGSAMLDTFRLPLISKEWATTGTFWKTLRTGIPETDMAGKVLMDDSFQVMCEKIPFMGKPLGKILTAPFNLLAAADEGFATVAARAENGRLSMLRSFDEVASLVKQGEVPEAAFAEEMAKRYQKKLMTPDKDIWESAIQNKRDVTMTDPMKHGALATKFFDLFTPNPHKLKEGGFMAAVQYNAPHFVRAAVMPFYNIAVNMMKLGVRMTPGMNMLMKRFRDDIIAGGTRRADRITATAASFAAGWAIYEAADRNLLTGRLPYSGKNLGKGGRAPKYSINAALWGGDPKKWVSYEFAQPFAFLVGMVADARNLWIEQQTSDDNPVNPEEDDTESAMYKFMAILSENLLRGSFLTGPRQVADIVFDPDKKQRNAQYFVHSFLSSLVPGATGLQYWQRFNDPYTREVTSWWEGTLDKNFNSQNRPVKRDPLTGEKVEKYKLSQTYGDEPGRVALFKAGVNVQPMPRKITKDGQSYELNDEQWQELNDYLAEQDVMKDLNRLAKHPAMLRSKSDQEKAKKLRKRISKARERAKKKFLKKNKGIRKLINEARKREKRAHGGRGKSENRDISPYKDIVK
jgi:hypothetical protein